MNPRLSVYLLILLGLGGCVAPEMLLPRDGIVPQGIDLSGNWVLVNDADRQQRQLRDAIRRTDGIDDDEFFSIGNRPRNNLDQRATRRRVKGGLVYVFLEIGRSLKITQTPDGLFISFDRSVVEEYRFGEQRMVNVGEVEAQRVTGWDSDTLVVETLDRNNMKMTERYRLLDNGRRLERRITLRSKTLDEETIVQEFDRESR